MTGCNFELRFPDFDLIIFDTIVYWMYTGRFWDPMASKDGKIPLSMDHVLEVYFCAVAEGFKLLACDALDLVYHLTVQEWKPLVSAAKTIYDSACAEGPIKRFLLDFAMNVWGFDLESHIGTDFPAAFLEDGLKMLKN